MSSRKIENHLERQIIHSQEMATKRRKIAERREQQCGNTYGMVIISLLIAGFIISYLLS